LPKSVVRLAFGGCPLALSALRTLDVVQVELTFKVQHLISA